MKTQKPYLLDILTSIEKIEGIVSGISFSDFMYKYEIYDVVMYNFIVVGEASNRISVEFKNEHPSIEWHKLKGMRNHLANSYDEINYRIVWETILNDLPHLKTQTPNIIQNL